MKRKREKEGGQKLGQEGGCGTAKVEWKWRGGVRGTEEWKGKVEWKCD